MHLICNLFLQTFDSLRWNPGCCDATGNMQVQCQCFLMGPRTGHYVLAGVHQATKKPNAVNSFLSKHSGSSVLIGPSIAAILAARIAAMRAWLHCTISVSSATWHWEGGIRWLHYCKCLAPVTHTNTRTHVCAFCLKCTCSHLYKLHAQSGDTDGRSIVICILLHLAQIIN